MNRWYKAQLVFLAVTLVGAAGLWATLFLGAGAPWLLSLWGAVALVGLVGNCVCALLRLSQSRRK